MFVWDDILAVLSIATFVSGAFNFIILSPLKTAIAQNNDLLDDLRKELERSAIDRRGLDKRIARLEEAHSINKTRLEAIEAELHRLGGIK